MVHRCPYYRLVTLVNDNLPTAMQLLPKRFLIALLIVLVGIAGYYLFLKDSIVIRSHTVTTKTVIVP